MQPSVSNLNYMHQEFRGESPENTALEAAADQMEKKQQPMVNAVPKVGRNDMCPCQSGRKYKHCHGKLK
jgi:preprotein translocase subunit SecA